MTRLREELLEHLVEAGGVLTARQLAEAVLARRAAGAVTGRRALEMASGAARAAVETEQGVEEPRFVLVRERSLALVAIEEPLAAWARRLGEKADAIAAEDPLASPARALQRLREVERPDLAGSRPPLPPLSPPSDDQLLRLAAAASATAAVSPRGEVYPRGLAAERALALARGAVAGLGVAGERPGGGAFTPEDVEARVRSRYPAAAPLPPRPALDRLLQDLGLDVTWDDAADRYRRRQPQLLNTRGSSMVESRPAGKTSRRHPSESHEAVVVREFEERLRRALGAGGFLAIGASPAQAVACEREIVKKLGIERVSCDRLLIELLRAAAREAAVDWDIVLETDRAGPGSPDWPHLRELVRKAVADLEREILSREKPALLVHLGLLGRYEEIGLLERLRDQAGRRGVCPAVWALFAADETSELPKIDGDEVPVISPGEFVRAPAEWFSGAEGAKAVTA